MKFCVIDDIKKIDSLEADWIRLNTMTSNENPFLSWEWNRSWLESFHEVGDVRIIVISEGDSIVCIAPLLIHNSRLSFLADDFFADYSDFITTNDKAFDYELLIDIIIDLKGWKKLSLATIPESSGSIKRLGKALKNISLKTEIKCIHLNPIIDTTGNFEDYLTSRSNGIRQELRRSKNKLDKTYSTWEFFEAETPQDRRQVMESLIRLHLARQSGKVGTSIFQEEKNAQFYLDLAANTNPPWRLHLAGIQVDGELITASISIIYQDVLYYWITAFDNKVGGGSIGNLHVKFLAEKCFREGYKRLDFMGGTEAYKLRWATDTYQNFEVVAYRKSHVFYIEKMWALVRLKLQSLKNRSPTVNKMWIKISKLIKK